jgi:hypothetical protein
MLSVLCLRACSCESSHTLLQHHITHSYTIHIRNVQGGLAIAKLLLGHANFSGRQPLTYLKSGGYTPLAYHHKLGQRCTQGHGALGTKSCEVASI